jgi:dTDP-4-amino-4,6-dideoxygalactose transaminase
VNNMNERLYLSPPHVSKKERELLLDAFDSNWIAPIGPHVDAFEHEFAKKVGMADAAALCSGTAALHLSLIILGIKPGDEVLTSTFTFAATANAITYAGAIPVFIDSDRRSWNMDPSLLAEEIKNSLGRGVRPKAVIAVDLYGQCADFEPIQEICQENSIPLIEDAAEALGASYKSKAAGSFGDLACFSFNGNKIITTSGGGMLVSRSTEWVEQARFLATQARDSAPHYQHSKIGYNYRLSNLLAAIGRGQLHSLEDKVRIRRKNFEYYRQTLDDLHGIEFMPEYSGSKCTRWLTCITIDPKKFGADREMVRLALDAKNIEARPLWKPMHQQPVFLSCRVRGGDVSADLFSRGLCLPSGSNLEKSDLQRVVEIIRMVGAKH